MMTQGANNSSAPGAGPRRTRPRGSRKPHHGVGVSFLGLPDDVLYIILKFCSLQSLGRLSRCCHRMRHLVEQDCIWIWLRNSLSVTFIRDYHRTNVGNVGEREQYRVKDQCRFSLNWERQACQDIRHINYREKQLPWLQLDARQMWISNKNLIKCYTHKADGSLRDLPLMTLRGHRQDVGRFVSKDNIVVSGARDGSILAHCAATGQPLIQMRDCHASDVQAIDFYQDLIVSGSRDATVKLWSMSSLPGSRCVESLAMGDRVWSLAMNPDGESFATGTAGRYSVPPLQIWNTNRTQRLASLGAQYKHGAGMLDVQYETPHTLWSCGYDTYIRFWDLRTSHTNCVLIWEEPYDSTVYCVKSDGHYRFVTGTARYGLVHLWDKRHTKSIQMFYTGREGRNQWQSSSPVYCLAFDVGHLYVALDRGINMLDFTGYG